MTALHALPRRDVALLALAFLAIGFVAVLRSERGAAQPDTYSTYDAAAGGYRGWYELLEREGIAPLRFDERAAFLDASVGTLVLSDEPGPSDFTAVDAAAVADWVRRGGRLIVLGDGLIVAKAASALRLPGILDDPPSGARPLIAPELRAAGVRGLPAVAAARLRARPTDRVLVADRSGRLIVRYPLGRGTVVDAIDAAALSNEHIALPDRARLAVALARIAGPRGPFAFDESVHGYLVPEHWWTALPARLVAAIVAALAVVALALAGSALRLGPPLAPEAPQRPASGGYLDALATLFERARARHKALADARRSIGLLVARSPELPAPQRAAVDDLEGLTHGTAPTDDELIRGLGLAVALRKEIGAYGRGG